ncbi:hypothetical protein KZZ52_24135 [Dactylosporangium sp. AC04546]|uniref:hypothetical protein n=1 Tax=Dactylosporangium sp. AC04546 TaxID=2862460 RepID=UPI001EDFD88D|nr:hypothetical protein [Dactylosporangium sp. AC04546]WVK88365.1 hypothetical protein KZZ52_24135 [Dactylosporangium sp. AC04546]
MNDSSGLVQQAIDAARADDADTLRRLIDWPLVGARDVGRGLGRIPASMRVEVVSSGLHELEIAATHPEVVAEYLVELAPWLLAARGVAVETGERRAAALAALQFEPVPPGLPEELAARIERLRARAAQVSEVYVVHGDLGGLTVMYAPDTRRLVPLLPSPA